MSTNRRTQLKIAYAPGFATQSGFGVPLSSGSLTKVLTTREGGQSHIEPIFKDEDLRDCSTQYLLDKIVLHRIAKLTLDLECDQEILGGLLGLAFGNPGGITMLGPTTYILPATTLRVGFADGEDPGIMLSDAVVDQLTLTGSVDQKFQVKVVFIGRGDMVAGSGAFPECSSITPLRFDQDSLFTVNGTEYIEETRKIDFTYDNKCPINDFPFALGALDITRALERGDNREYVVNWTVTGREGDALGAACVTVPPTHYDFLLRIGSGTEGISIVAADAMLRPQGSNFQTFDGEVSIACLGIALTPILIPGDSSTPLTANIL